MSAAAYVFPNAVQNLAAKTEKWTSTADNLVVGLIASGTYTRGSGNYGQTTVANFLAGDGTNGAITEVASGLGYTRTNLSGVTFTTASLVSTLNCTSPISWTASSNFSAKYAFFYDGANTTTNDATTNELIAYWDFGGTVSVVAGGNFTLTINASGIITFTVTA